MQKRIVAHVEDLMFRAKIDSAGRNLNIPVEFVAKVGDLLRACVNEPAAVFVELTDAALPAIAKLKKNPKTRSVPVVGFLSHMDKKLAEEARQQGADRVLPRSQFSETLPELILEFTSPGVERIIEEEPELPEE
jgi:CheY-like chemotaxis protein